ncbi:MAG: M48 family metalloprotease [Gammaproteobacteria bacterium]
MILRPVTTLSQGTFHDLPDLGDASGKTISPQQDQALGAEFMRQIRQEGMVRDDPEITSYLQALGQRLVLKSEDPGHSFSFFLVDEPDINAFAGPGGYIGINAGLFLAAETESELAGVMAHEIAHVTQRHLARAFGAADRMSLPSAAALLAAILIGTQDSQAGAAALTAASAASMQYQINFTRANEEEADRVGIQTLAEAGLDPFGMPRFFERLQKNSRLYGTRPPEFLSTHPVTTNRIAEAVSRAESYPTLKGDTGLDFQLLRVRLRVSMYNNPKQVLADFQRYQGKPDSASPVNRYEYALLLNEAGKNTEAQAIMRELHKEDPDRISYRLALAGILGAGKEYSSALDVYTDTLQLYPGNVIVLLPYCSTLLAADQADKAYSILNGITERASDNPEIYKLLAQAARSSGHTVHTHTAMSQYYFLSGFTQQAIDQLKRAEQQPGLSDYESARIVARIKNLELLLERSKLE